MHDLNLLFSKKHDFLPCTIEKQFSNEDGVQLVIRVGDIELHKFWYKFNNKADKSKSKTGGKPAYSMIIERDLEKFISETSPDFEVMGYLWPLLSKTSWHTGVLKYKRRKKPLQFDDFMEIFDKGRTKTADIINKLKKYGILSHDKDGYKLSRSFIKKGGKKRETMGN